MCLLLFIALSIVAAVVFVSASIAAGNADRNTGVK